MAVCNLPVEVIAKIFLYLDAKSKGRAAQVCSSWREASFHRPAWCGVSAKIKIDSFAELICTNLARRDIKDVQVTCIEKKLVHLLRLIPHLEKLNFSHCRNLSEANLIKTFKTSCDYLTVLNLSMCSNLTTEGVRTALYACEKLQVLDLSGCCKLSNDVLFVIALHLTELKTLNISHTSVTDQGLQYFPEFHPHNGRRQCIERLVMMNCRLVTDKGLESISKGMPWLKALNLKFCRRITNSGMTYIANMQSLRELDLQHCEKISNNGLLNMCSSGTLHLLSLNIGPCVKITNVGLMTVALNMRTLQHVKVDSCDIDDDGILYMCRKLLNLRSLNISECSITDTSLAHIYNCSVRLGLLRHLRHINIYRCCGVTSVGFSWAKQVPGLSVTSVPPFYPECL